MKITKQELAQLIKEELDTMLSEQPRPGSLGARAAQRSRDRASQGLGQTPTEKRVRTGTGENPYQNLSSTQLGQRSRDAAALGDTETAEKLSGEIKRRGRPENRSTASIKRQVQTMQDTELTDDGKNQLKQLQNVVASRGTGKLGARTGAGASTQTAGEQERRVAGAADTSGIRTGGAGMDSAAFKKPMSTTDRQLKSLRTQDTIKPATAATKSAAPKSRKAGSKDAYFKTLSRMSDRGTIKPWQQKKLDTYKTSQTPAKPAPAKVASTPTMGQATGMGFLDKPAEDEAIAAATDFLKETAISEHIETIVNEILSRLNQ